MSLNALMKSDQVKSSLSGFLGGAAGGALVSAFTKKKSAKKLLKAGGLVTLGGVVWSAYQSYQSRSNSSPSHTQIVKQDIAAATAERAPCVSDMALFRAMAAAAFADGHIDQAESDKIWQSAVEHGLEGEALNRFAMMLKHPRSMAEVLADANDTESKLEVYAASALVIDDACASGKRYMEKLKLALDLPAPLLASVDHRLKHAD